MELKSIYVQDRRGNVLPGAIAHLYLAGTTTHATGLEDADGNALGNPFAADSSGLLQFAAPNGEYDLRAIYGGQEYSVPLRFYDTSEVDGRFDEVDDQLGTVDQRLGTLDQTVDTVLKNDLVFHRSIEVVLPLLFPDYSAARAAVGNPSFIYPQGHCYDAAGRVFIKYAAASIAYGVIAWYTPDKLYGGWFLIPAGGESLVMIHEGGSRKMYSRAGADDLHVYDITTMPANGASIVGASVGIPAVGLQYAYGNGRWIVEQVTPDVGIQYSRTKWTIYDKNFVRKGHFFVAKNIVGWNFTTGSNYQHVPKSQGVALHGDTVVFGLGGSYLPSSDGPTSNPYSSFGLAVCSLDGRLTEYGTLKADALLTRFAADGVQAVRTESEGVTIRPDGYVSHLLVTANPTTPWANTAGIILFGEMDPLGSDYSSIQDPYVPFNLSRTYEGVFPRAIDGLINPISNVAFTSLVEIISYMANIQVPSFSWYSSAVPIITPPALPIPSAALVTISNANNLGFRVRVSVAAGDIAEYYVTYDSSTESISVGKEGIDVTASRVGVADSGGNIAGRIRTQHFSQTDADILVLTQQSTSGGNLLSLGGGSSLYYAATRIWAFIAASATSKTGVNVAEFFTNGFNPGADVGFDLGTLVKRWRELFVSKITCTGPVRPGQYTLATLPDPALFSGYEIDVTDATGGAKRCRSDGTAWKILNTTTTVS